MIGEAGQEVSGNAWDAVCCVNGVLQLNYFRRNGSPTLPLYLYHDDLLLDKGSSRRRTNLSPEPFKRIAEALGLQANKSAAFPDLAPEDIFGYAYAVFHSPGYRNRYAEFLKTDFPRLPLTGDLQLFRRLACLGSELVALHLLQSPKLNDLPTTYDGPANPEVEKLSYARQTVWLDKAQTKGFRGAPEAVWNFHVGGYQVCEKWLKDRKGKTLSNADIAHYQRVIVALSETIRIMAEIDKVIDAHGGWPGAFVTGEKASGKGASK